MKLVISILLLALAATATSADTTRNLRGNDVAKEHILAEIHLAPTAKVEFLKIGNGIVMISTSQNEDDSQILNKVLDQVTPDDEQDAIRLWQKVAPEHEVMPPALKDAAEEVMKAMEEDNEEADNNEGDDRNLQNNCDFYEKRTGRAVIYRFTRQLRATLTSEDVVGLRIAQKQRSPNPNSPFPWDRICAHCPYDTLVSRKGNVLNLRTTAGTNIDVRVETFDAYYAVFDLEVCYQ